MGTLYRDYILNFLPTWLRSPTGMDGLHQGKGDAKDSLVERAKDAVKARFPLLAPTDALRIIGNERGIPRGQAEADAAYGVRLQHAWDSWPFAGTPLGLLNALRYAGYTVALVQFRRYGYTLDASGGLVVSSLQGGSWTFDGSLTNWARFAVIFLPPFPTSWLAASPPAIVWLSSTGIVAGVITSSTPMASDVRIVLVVTTAGTTGSTARVKYSLDNGLSYSAPMTFAAMATALAPYATLVVASTSVLLGDVCYVAPTFNVPADGSTEASFVKSIVAQWKPVSVTVSKYILPTRGQVLGWPVTKFLGTGINGVPLRLGGGTQVTWSP